MKVKKGDFVTVKESVSCRYSGYGGRPVKSFHPGDVAVVLHPKTPKAIHNGKGSLFFVTIIPLSFQWDEGVSPDLSNLEKITPAQEQLDNMNNHDFVNSWDLKSINQMI